MIPRQLHRALLVPLTLPVGEADAALVAELLVGKNRGDRFVQAPSSEEPSTILRLAVARVLAVGCLRFLMGAGGARSRTVLRQGRRQQGRLGDAALNLEWSTHFSPMAFDLVWNLATVVVPLARQRSEKSLLLELSRDERRILRRATVAPALTAFDHVWCVLALENRSSLRLPEIVDDVCRRSLIEASPLCALFEPDDPLSPTAALGALCTPQNIRLFEVADDAIAAAFGRRLRQVWSCSSGAEFISRCEAFSATLRAWVKALNDAQRLDLIGPVVRLVCAFPEVLPFDSRARLLHKTGIVTMADRDRAAQALQSLVDLALELDAIAVHMRDQRYGDDRYDEAQLVLRVLDDFGVRRAVVAAFSRALSGSVG